MPPPEQLHVRAFQEVRLVTWPAADEVVSLGGFGEEPGRERGDGLGLSVWSVEGGRVGEVRLAH